VSPPSQRASSLRWPAAWMLLRLVPEREEGHFAPRVRAGARDAEHLLGRRVDPLPRTRRVGEGAVAAVVPAQFG
jgi:hypothetical protein